MKNELNNLIALLKQTPQSNEVDLAIKNLEDKIDEVENRIECAVRSAKEINKTISKYTEEIDDGLPIKMSVSDHDVIQNCSDDVRIALDLNDNMSIVDNWYNLFQVKKEPIKQEVEPIAVGNIEYDFPEEVYTIGNADNTEIIGDVYESAFHEFLDLGILVLEDSDNFPFGKTNYIVLDNKFISIVKKKQIDLSKVPIIKQEVFVSFESSWGTLTCDKHGNVIEVIGDEEYNGERNYLYDIAKIDLVEYGSFLNSIGQKLDHDEDDILSVGFWKKDDTYNEPDKGWRKNMFSPEDDEDEAPTMLCQDEEKHDAVKDIIAKLKEIEVDGETMEYILDQVGILDQVAKQLGFVNF